MNRKNLTSAVLAGLAGVAGIASTAQAVNINPDGLGQVLLYPYYTVQGGNETLISVVNTTDAGKAVKVRFLEGENSQEVLDFNLYMSPFDVWTAAVVQLDVEPNEFDAATTVPGLITADTTCTVPYLFADAPDGQPFLPFRLNDKGQESGVFESVWPRGAEGHLEMLEMGEIEGGSLAAATHDDTGVPADCDQLVTAWFSPAAGEAADPDFYWTNDPTTDALPPGGGLFGSASIVNVSRGTLYSYDAIAVNGWNTSGIATSTGASLHTQPGVVEPNLNSGDNTDATVFLDDGTTLVSSGLTRSVDAVSFLFMHDQVMNEYVTENVTAAQTEWVMTFPTKKFYTFAGASGSATPLAPFTEQWSEQDEDTGVWGACENVLLTGIYDREEQTPGVTPGDPIPPIVSPAPPRPPAEPFVPFELCYETSVIEFMGVQAMPADGHEGSGILGSQNVTTFDNGALGFENGWAKVELVEYKEDVTGDTAFRDGLGGLAGLPVTGFSVVSYTNGFLDGGNVLANYGGIFKHKATRLASS